MSEKKHIYFRFLYCFLLTSCSAIEEISVPVDTYIYSLEEAKIAFNNASLNGWMLSAINYTENGDISFTFENGSAIISKNSTCIRCLSIDNKGVWCINEKMGGSFSPLYDSGGDVVRAEKDDLSPASILKKYVTLPFQCESIETIIGAIAENNSICKVAISLSDGGIFEFQKNGPVLRDFSIIKEDNPNLEFEDIHYIVSTNKLIAYTPYFINRSDLAARFTVEDNCKVFVSNVEQKSGISHNNYSDGIKYKVISEKGDVSFYEVQIKHTKLPVVYIRTPNEVAIDSKTEWLSDVEISIYNDDGSLNYFDNKLQIRGRGNSTWGRPKKPYALKLNNKSKILGMKEHKRWCLLANWKDRTLLRNDIAFEISRKTGLQWTPQGKFVELVLNGKHVGNYYLCEQIKIDENRVNIERLTQDDISGESLTGGYLLELDKHYDEDYKFISDIKGFPYMFKNPDDELQLVQYEYLKDYINNFERSLYSDNGIESGNYLNYIDLSSFADYWFVYELSSCWEPNHPKSSYMHKNRNGKIVAGPVWDFDFGTFWPTNSHSFIIKEALYYDQLFSDARFVDVVKNRWKDFHPKFREIIEAIRYQAAIIEVSEGLNHAMWPISSDAIDNGDENMTYIEAVERMIKAFETKLDWLNEQIIHNM